jgi:hypothetical protein
MIKTSDEGTSYCTQCEIYAKEIEKLKQLIGKERDKFGVRETAIMKENAKCKRVIEDRGHAFQAKINEVMEENAELREYVEHRNTCIRACWQAGEPTPGGGYRTMFNGKWYQSRPVNEEPKCDCGLDDILA